MSAHHLDVNVHRRDFGVTQNFLNDPIGDSEPPSQLVSELSLIELAAGICLGFLNVRERMFCTEDAARGVICIAFSAL